MRRTTFLGIITADDAADVLFEEADEDIQRLGGSQPLEEPYLRASIGHLFRKRAPWLLFLFIGQAYTSSSWRSLSTRSRSWSRWRSSCRCSSAPAATLARRQ